MDNVEIIVNNTYYPLKYLFYKFKLKEPLNFKPLYLALALLETSSYLSQFWPLNLPNAMSVLLALHFKLFYSHFEWVLVCASSVYEQSGIENSALVFHVLRGPLHLNIWNIYYVSKPRRS